jgi:hypothetical protein
MKINNNLIQKIDGKGEKLLNENVDQNKETILVKLKGSFGEGLVLTDKRLYVLKWGFMTGNTFGGRCNAFDYNIITGLEIKKGLLTGTFEVLTPATQNAQKSYWGSGKDSAAHSDNVITIQRDKFQLFQEATRVGRELINQLHSKNQPTGNKESNYSELEKLAELKSKGIITEEEFEAKKKKILAL